MKSVFGNDHVHLAFLGHAFPSLANVVDEIKLQGLINTRIQILPLFISGGGHVDRDIPKQIRTLSRKYPGMDIKLLSALGEREEIKKAIASIARKVMRI